MSVRKRDFVMRITYELSSEEPVIKQQIVSKILDKFLELIIDSLEKGKKIEFRNFGTFKVEVRKGRPARNPKTKEEVRLPDRKKVIFKAGKIMREKVEVPVENTSRSSQESSELSSEPQESKTTFSDNSTSITSLKTNPSEV